MAIEFDLEEWARGGCAAPFPKNAGYIIRLWVGDGFDTKRLLKDPMPNGAQILDAFDLHPTTDHVLLLLGRQGVQEIAHDELVDLRERGAERFFAFRSDRVWYGAYQDRRFPWGANCISAQVLRDIFKIPSNTEIVLAKKNGPDQILGHEDIVGLDDAGVERIYRREPVWRLLVQGILLTFNTPKVIVKEALLKAGLDPDRGWTAVLKFANGPREKVSLTDTIDLSREGIEKLWLRPDHVNNGDASPSSRREFNLRPDDERYLTQRELPWETVVEGNQRWLIIRGYETPPGYQQPRTDVAVLIPPSYPAAMLDMFYCFPPLQLESARPIPCTEARQTIESQPYQRWSRHRDGTTAWNPANDNLITHIALIDDAISREVDGAA